MGKEEITRLHDKLDDIQNLNSKEHKDLSVILSRLDQHQTEINGTIVELKKEVLENKASIIENKGSIVFAKGSIYGLGLLSTLLSVLAISKGLGLW